MTLYPDKLINAKKGIPLSADVFASKNNPVRQNDATTRF